MDNNINKKENQYSLTDFIDAGLDSKYGTYKGMYAKRNVISVGELLKREYADNEWYVNKFLPKEGITMFVGTAGSGKSYLAGYMAYCLTHGENFLDRQEFSVKEKVPCLLIDKENGLRRLNKRLSGLGFAGNEELYVLEYPESFNLDDSDFLEYISSFIEEKKIKVVILDSFIDVVKGNENSSTDTAEVFNKLRSISSSVAWVILHHEAKQSSLIERSAGDKTRGSTNIIGQLAAQFHIRKDPENPMRLIVEQGKARDYEPIEKIWIQFVANEESVTGFSYGGIIDNEEMSKFSKVMEFVEEVIGAQPMKLIRKDILALALEYGFKERTIDRAIKELINAGKLSYDSKVGEDKKKKYYFLVAKS